MYPLSPRPAHVAYVPYTHMHVRTRAIHIRMRIHIRKSIRIGLHIHIRIRIRRGLHIHILIRLHIRIRIRLHKRPHIRHAITRGLYPREELYAVLATN